MPPGPTQFGKYELLERIAAGGMAEVYRARFNAAQGVTKPMVIKKILPAYAGNEAFISMFVNEAKIALRLSHGSIAQVFDFGEVDGEYFLAMEFVHGQPLSKILKRAREQKIRALPTPFAVLTAIELCRGLHYAHTRLDDHNQPLNIIHRDVSAQNVLIGYEGEVKIVDFGIAKARTAGMHETQAGAVKGKYVYFAPEQARGRSLDSRTDVYAAGVCLYEMVCGRLPFEGKMVDVLERIVRGDFQAPSLIDPDITPALERIIMTAMALDREQRYPTALAMQEELSEYLYANAPTFSNHQLAELMHFLYEPELKAEGIQIKHKKEFLEQVEQWKTGSGFSDPYRPAARSGSKGRANTESRTRAPRHHSVSVAIADRLRRIPQAWLFAGVTLLAVLAGGAVVAAMTLFEPAQVQLTSSPPGASVWIDGHRAPSVTPILIKDLSPDPHTIEVQAAGKRRWTRKLEPEPGGSVTLHAVLETERRRDREQSAETDDDGAEARSSREIQWPVHSFELAARHAFLVPPSRAARIRLDPAKTYKLWTEGELLSGQARIADVLYFVEGELNAEHRFGALGAGPIEIGGGTALYAFVLDDEPGDNHGVAKIRIEDPQTNRVSTLVVDARAHALRVPPSQKLAMTRLDKGALYQVQVHEGAVPASVLPGADGKATRVAMVQQNGWRVLEVGKRYQVFGTEFAAFTFPDDAAHDNVGGMVVEVTPLEKAR